VRGDRAFRPSLSLIIAAHNEADVIVAKLDNTQALNYPAHLIEIIVASDGSDDATETLVEGYGASNVRLLRLPRQGKNRSLNDAVAAARNDILVFSDADSMLQRDALLQLVAPLADPDVGGVGGDYRYAKDANASGERTYWSVDRALKGWQSQADSMTSATGQIFALRRRLFQPMPDGVTDDFFTSIQAPVAHQRLVFEPRAVATGPVATSAKAEFRRKVRVITAGLRGVWHVRAALNPRTHGWFALQLFSHKVLRRLTVLPLLALSVSAPLLWRRGWLYRFTALGLWGVHGLGALGFLLRGTRLGRSKLLSLPFFFELVNAAVLTALVGLLRGERHDTWVPQRVEQTTVDGDRVGGGSLPIEL
jgi:cellulose synthase/poly-beta-1,6-N-acetylglucosamine synthase-like glycosyltransferase